MSDFWRLIDNKVVYERTVDRLGYPVGEFELPTGYIDSINMIPIYRTAHGFGDWVILSALPRLLKNKFNKEILIPSSDLIYSMFKPLFLKGAWDSWNEPWKMASYVFKNNPYIDGEFSEFNGEILSDHIHIYDTDLDKESLASRMLRVYGFSETERQDTLPELYFDDIERTTVDQLLQTYIGKNEFTFLLLSNRHIHSAENNLKIQKVLDTYDFDKILYWSATPIEQTYFSKYTNLIDINTITTDIRLQILLRMSAVVNIGTQSGVLDCMARYTDTYEIPHTNKNNWINGNYVRGITYI